MKSLVFTLLLLATRAFGADGIVQTVNGTTVAGGTVKTTQTNVIQMNWDSVIRAGDLGSPNAGGYIRWSGTNVNTQIYSGDNSDLLFTSDGNKYYFTGGVPMVGNGSGLTNIPYAGVKGQLWGTNAVDGSITNVNVGFPVNISGGNSNWFGGSVTVDTNISSTYGQFNGNGSGLSNVVAVATNFTAYAVGTAYTMTGSSAALTFGTTQPVLTINQAGTYMIVGTVGIKYNGATYAAAQTMTFKLRRTNNTAADLTNGARTTELPVLTTFTGGDAVTLPHVIYTATSGDTVTIFGILSATPAAGSVLADSADMIAIRIY